jgi:VIT1/CCC1 family predicted Fe2+/Mn2+ transporter
VHVFSNRFEKEDPYLTGLRSQLESAYREYDKLILSVSSGILAISAAFFHETVAPHLHVRLLITCWIALLVAIFTVAISLLIEQVLTRHLIRQNGEPDPTGDHLRTKILWLNAFSGISFVVGALFLVIYLCVNVNGV